MVLCAPLPAFASYFRRRGPIKNDIHDVEFIQNFRLYPRLREHVSSRTELQWLTSESLTDKTDRSLTQEPQVPPVIVLGCHPESFPKRPLSSGITAIDNNDIIRP